VHYWAISVLLIVFGVKYYTSVEMRKLERRLEKVKDDLQRAKEKLQQAQERQSNVQQEEEVFGARQRAMKETIEDIQMRMSAKEAAAAEDVVVADSAPPPRTF